MTSISSLHGVMFCFKQTQHSRALQCLSPRIAFLIWLGMLWLAPSSEEGVEFTKFQMLLSPFIFPRMVVGLLKQHFEALGMSCNIYWIVCYRIQIKKGVERRRRKRRIRSIKRIKSTRNTKNIRRRRLRQLQQLLLWLQQIPRQYRKIRKQRQNPKR